MPAIYQGDKKIVDRYVGETLITRAYQGDKLIFDAYSELSGTLPLTVRSRASQILKNYRIYGTASGAGVETENLFDYTAKDTSNGYVNNRVLIVGGSNSSSPYYISEYINVSNFESVSFFNLNLVATAGLVHIFLDEEKNRLSTFTVTTQKATRQVPTNAHYMQLSIKKTEASKITVVKGSTAPSSYIPYGYKLPLIVRTGNLFNKDAKNTENGYENNRYLNIGGKTEYNSEYYISEYIDISESQTITFSGAILPGVYCYFYDDSKTITGRYDGIQVLQVPTTFSVPQKAKYIRLTVKKVQESLVCLTSGTTPPDHYIPYYNIETPIYIGDSQLMEGEYVDYEKQKIYKRGENEFPFAEEGTFAFGNGSVISDGSGTFIINTENNDTNVPSELIPLTTPYTVPQTSGEYTFYLGGNDVNPGLLIVFYDSERNLVDDWMYNSAWRKESSIPLMVGKAIAYVGFRINTNYSGSANMSVTPMISKNNNLTAYVPYIQLTDPPVPLPDITIPKGEVTIDIDGDPKPQTTVKGRINPVT